MARMAGCAPVGVICEIVNEDGSCSRTPELLKFAAEHGLVVITIADLITYRTRSERLVDRTAVARLPTKHGTFSMYRCALCKDEDPLKTSSGPPLDLL
jgi:3,4-dihydroxy 2-butanone 4-phosphate synthase/GTP cyclohydrolase II